MWKELVEIFTGDDPLADVDKQLIELLDVAKGMYERVQPTIAGRSLDDASWKALLREDERINALERDVRRGVAAHLAIQSNNAPTCLKLMSLVKDGERLGEYVKNTAQVARQTAGAGITGEASEQLARLEALTLELFQKTPRLLEQQLDPSILIAEGQEAERVSDALSERALAGEGLSAAQAASLALLAFFHRRMVNHLLNLISSVTATVDDLDHYDERFTPES